MRRSTLNLSRLLIKLAVVVQFRRYITIVNYTQYYTYTPRCRIYMILLMIKIGKDSELL